jgi:hypothetical protein
MTLPIERLLQLSAITPLATLRRYLLQNPEVEPAEAVAALLTIDASFSASDHEAALHLHAVLRPDLLFSDFTNDLRQALTQIVLTLRPQWAKRVFLGRARFLSELEKIDSEVRRCFREAGLFAENPPDDVVHWWDCLNHEVRGVLNFENLLQGRIAEQKSLAYERSILKELGIELEPKWQAIEDNTVGYDILSYRLGDGFPINRLIEVKSSSRDPPAVIISRDEWRKAKAAKESYFFHVWDVRADKMHEWSFDMISDHMPCNRGKGSWTSVEVPIKAIKA